MLNKIVKLKKCKTLILSLPVFALTTCLVLISITACGSANTNSSEIFMDNAANFDDRQVIDLERNVEDQTTGTDYGEEIYVDGINYFDASLNTEFAVNTDAPLAGSLRRMYPDFCR